MWADYRVSAYSNPGYDKENKNKYQVNPTRRLPANVGRNFYRYSSMRPITFFISILLFVLQSCVVEPKIPSVNLLVHNGSNYNIDTITIYSDSLFTKPIKNLLNEDLDKYRSVYFIGKGSSFSLKVWLSNSTVLSSKSILKRTDYDGFIIKITDNGLTVIRTNKFLIIHYFLLILFTLLACYVFKVSFLSYIFKPLKKPIFTIKYTTLTFLYLLCLYLLFHVFYITDFYLITLIGFIISSISDYYVLKCDKYITTNLYLHWIIILNFGFYSIGAIIGLLSYVFIID